MKRLIKFATVWFTITSLILLSGCVEKTTLTSYKSLKTSSTNDIEIINENYSMVWDNAKHTIILKDVVTGEIWSTVPKTALYNNVIETGKKNSPRVESALFVTYYDTEKFVQSTLLSTTDAVKSGNVFAKKLNKDSISVMYDFAKAEISVVVDYKLNSDGMQITVNPNKITEGEKKLVTNIAIAPYICSVDNGIDDAYIFVPSGSGTLIYSKSKTFRSSEVAEEVYGNDLAVNREFTPTVTSKVGLPVYGSIDKNRGMFAIIEKGAEACNIVSSSSNNNLNYTTVYADFSVRGYEIVEQPEGMQGTSGMQKIAKVYSNPNKLQSISVRFIPLQGEGISYVDMAKKYSSYLTERYKLDNKVADEAVSLRIIGGIMSTEYNFGIPRSALIPLTTIEQAKTMIEKLEDSYDGLLLYNLDGFGKTGLDIGAIAGGYGINGRLGSTKQLKDLFRYCGNEKINLFMNFDLVRFNKSNNGFDAAIAATQKRIIKNHIDIVTKNSNMAFNSYWLIRRSQLQKAMEKLEKFAENNHINGISLDTLSNKLYSDYSEEKYYSKSATNEISNEIKNLSKNDRKILTTNANLYAAVYSDYIDGISVQSSDYDAYDCDIPFYQMVFSGLVPMYSSNFGSASENTELMLKSIESGIGISMSATYDYNKEILSSPQKSAYSWNFENVINAMETLKENEFFQYYSKIKGASIIEHKIISPDVRKTVFDNNVEVYVNYSDSVYESSEIKIAPRSYVVKGGNYSEK